MKIKYTRTASKSNLDERIYNLGANAGYLCAEIDKLEGLKDHVFNPPPFQNTLLRITPPPPQTRKHILFLNKKYFTNKRILYE